MHQIIVRQIIIGYDAFGYPVFLKVAEIVLIELPNNTIMHRPSGEVTLHLPGREHDYRPFAAPAFH